MAPPQKYESSSSMEIWFMMASPMVLHSNAPFAHKVSTAVVFCDGLACMYRMYSAGFFATTLSYEDDRNSFWHSDLRA